MTKRRPFAPPSPALTRRALLGGAAAGLSAAVLSACSSQGSAGPAAVAGPAGAGLPSPHVHGIARDPGDGKVHLATHEGLFRYDGTGPVLVGPVIDLMGFAVAGPGRFYASGHPGIGVDLPEPVGLIRSTDGGQTWAVRSRGGQSDFHALTVSDAGVLGFDGALRGGQDGAAWHELSIPAEPRALAASPDGALVLATTSSGVLGSTDQGATWSPIPTAPRLLLVDWADTSTAAGVTPDGALAVSRDAGRTWTTGSGAVGAPPQALCASVGRKELEVLVVTHDRVQRSTDLGHSFAPFPSL